MAKPDKNVLRKRQLFIAKPLYTILKTNRKNENLNFKQQIAKYVTGNIMTSQLPEIAIIGLQEGLESDSLLVLAGLSEKDNSFEIIEYFEKAIEELNIDLPKKRQAAIIYIEGIADSILNGEKDIIKGIYEIKNNAFDSYDFRSETDKYLYDSIEFEKIYGLFESYYDIKDSGSNLNKKKILRLRTEIKEELFTRLQMWKEKIKNGV